MTAPAKRDTACEGNACCKWIDFREGFEEAWRTWFDAPPTEDHWKAAVRDWRKANTGYEAAHNAMRRARDAAEKSKLPSLEHLGGQNYAFAGSALARRIGAPPAAEQGKEATP